MHFQTFDLKQLFNEEGDQATVTFPTHHPLLSPELWKTSITLLVNESIYWTMEAGDICLSMFIGWNWKFIQRMCTASSFLGTWDEGKFRRQITRMKLTNQSLPSEHITYSEKYIICIGSEKIRRQLTRIVLTSNTVTLMWNIWELSSQYGQGDNCSNYCTNVTEVHLISWTLIIKTQTGWFIPPLCTCMFPCDGR